jgi:hypothetical protein
MKLQKYVLSSCNFIDFVLIVFHDVVSLSNFVEFCNISSASGSQQPTIVVQVINLSDFLGTKLSLLNSPS